MCRRARKGLLLLLLVERESPHDLLVLQLEVGSLLRRHRLRRRVQEALLHLSDARIRHVGNELLLLLGVRLLRRRRVAGPRRAIRSRLERGTARRGRVGAR